MTPEEEQAGGRIELRNQRQNMLIGYIVPDIRKLVETYGYIAVRRAVLEATWGAAEHRVPRWIFPPDILAGIDAMIREQNKRENERPHRPHP
jgi:hypothetical protein